VDDDEALLAAVERSTGLDNISPDLAGSRRISPDLAGSRRPSDPPIDGRQLAAVIAAVIKTNGG